MFRRFLSQHPKYTVHSKQNQNKTKRGKDYKKESNYVNGHLRGRLGRQNEYLGVQYIPRIPPPWDINERIDSRDEYDDNPREEVNEVNEAKRGKFGVWYGWTH